MTAIPVTLENSSEPAPISYDSVLYPGSPFSQTHPRRLATLASLHGMTPAPPSKCRVLELGCGDGGNLIPMAYQFPDSEFIGVDLSSRAVEIGVDKIADIGLRNIELHALDITKITPALGRFDYIICHGVYSWVPPAVRAKVMSIFRAHLAPQGIAYVSYNCQPGSYLRDMTRAIMLYHVRDTDDPQQRLQQGRLLLQVLSETNTETDPYGFALRSQHERVRKTPDAVLYHDDLDSGAEAFFLHQVVEAAGREGLQYVSDASSPILTGNLMELRGEPEAVVKLMLQIPEEDWATREQYFDFARGRMFRETLLCNREIKLERPLRPGRIKHFQLSSELPLETADLDLNQPGATEFKTRSGQKVRTDHRLTKAAFVHLATIWPQTIGAAELMNAALARLGQTADLPQSDWDAQFDQMAQILLSCFCAGAVEIDAFPLDVMSTISNRPKASLLVRKQVDKGPLLTNLRHGIVAIEDPVTKSLIRLLDGTRTVDQLVTDLAAIVDANQSNDRKTGDTAGPTVSHENVVNNLQMLVKLGLLNG
jgi:SAM-dependent methyltransferase/methyltransferase-like protein